MCLFLSLKIEMQFLTTDMNQNESSWRHSLTIKHPPEESRMNQAVSLIYMYYIYSSIGQ